MGDVATTLATLLLILGVGSLVFWPRNGMLARWRRMLQHSTRVLTEDALKHCYDCEYKKVSCSLQSISGSLSVSVDRAATVVNHLETLNLVRVYSHGIELTPEGRTYALRVIRIHRLWERHLAEETSLPETAWHPAAELKEHRLSPDEAETLARKMGNPRFDPHGDPIPTSSGEMPPPLGVPLHSLREGDRARITHVEDEPQALYGQLVAQGIYPGMQIRILESTSQRIRFDAEGEELALAPLLASQVTVMALTEEDTFKNAQHSLATLMPGDEGMVIGISRSCRGQQRRRLMDLGIVPGSRIRAEFASASGDPTAYTVRGTTIALRRSQANYVYIEPREKKNNG